MTVERRRLLALQLPLRHVHDGARELSPYLLHHAALPGLVARDEATRLLLVHPRLRARDELPAPALALAERRGGAWTHHDLELAPRVWRELFLVQFASRSKDAPPLAPGLPRGWRRVLSNFATHQTLEIDGLTYASVEHYFQGAKARCSTRPEMARWFCQQHDGPERVGDDPREAKKTGSRKRYQQRGAQLDVDRWTATREQVMRAALDARWRQDALFRRVLESTRGLRLLHFERAAARSFWGGALDKQTGAIKGSNRLGELMMALRDGA